MQRSKILAAVGAAACVWAVVAPGAARAAGVNVQGYLPSPFARDFLSVGTSGIANPGFLTAGLTFHYTAHPLGFEGTDAFGRSAVEETVASRLMTEVLLSYAPIAWLDIGLAFPFVLLGDGKAAGTGISSVGDPSGFALGEARLAVRFGILREGVVRFGVQAEAALPTGDEDKLAGAGAGGGLKLLLDVKAGGFLASLNVGATFRGEAEIMLAGTDQVLVTSGHELLMALGAGYTVIDELQLVGETYLRTGFADFFGQGTSLLELMGGVRYLPSEQFALTAGGGGGTPLAQGYGTSQFRFFFDFRWLPEKPVTTDGDGDGLQDDEDACPLLPEDIDQFKDQDGCPDPDNDEDGILDGADACPNEAEDLDGHADEDGCPDDDDDGDGVPDARDQCKDAAEDVDGFEDGDGCPDPDNDGDGIADAVDKCPDAAETLNKFEDEDGCPDFPGVSIREDRIVLADPITFRSKGAELTAKHFDTLRNVARLIEANPAWKKVEIVAHTDAKSGKDEAELIDLTTRRAMAVQQFLITEGVNFKRVGVRGAGAAEPVAEDTSAKGREANNRVELIIKK